MKMIGHQAIDWSSELIAGAGVAQKFTELCMEYLAERKRLPVLGRMGPKDVGEPSVVLLGQPREFSFHVFKAVSCKCSNKFFPWILAKV